MIDRIIEKLLYILLALYWKRKIKKIFKGGNMIAKSKIGKLDIQVSCPKENVDLGINLENAESEVTYEGEEFCLVVTRLFKSIKSLVRTLEAKA